MTAEVLGGVLPLAVLKIFRWLEDLRPQRSGSLEVAVRVVDSHHHRLWAGLDS